MISAKRKREKSCKAIKLFKIYLRKKVFNRHLTFANRLCLGDCITLSLPFEREQVTHFSHICNTKSHMRGENRKKFHGDTLNLISHHYHFRFTIKTLHHGVEVEENTLIIVTFIIHNMHKFKE